MRNTLRHYLLTRNWLLGYEAWAGVRLTVADYEEPGQGHHVHPAQPPVPPRALRQAQ